ncbi:MAG: tetratricopeptide repeat protein, partial [Anaerolineae bacterium]
PSPTLTSTSTPTPTLTPTPTPAPTPTPTLTPTPTPQPAERLEAGRTYQRNGEYERAIAEYEALLSDKAAEEEAREASFLIGESHFLNGDYQLAEEALERFLGDYPDDERGSQALFLLARSYERAGDCTTAIEYYHEYLAQRDVIADYVHELIGDCYVNLEDYSQAIVAYGEALREAPSPERELQLMEKVADAYFNTADYSEAIAWYEALLAKAERDDQRAKFEYLIGQAYLKWGKTEEAHEHFLDAVDRYPKASHAYLALVELVDAGVEVDDFQRGLVDYYAGVYWPAIQAFYRYIEDNLDHEGDPYYYIGLAYLAVGSYESAMSAFDVLIERYPTSEYFGQAWLGTAQAFASQNRHDDALSTYREFARLYPSHELASEALWRAAALSEADKDYDEAARGYLDLQTRYPEGPHATTTLFQAGLCYHRLDEGEKAIEAWQELLDIYEKSDLHTQTLFWVGKALLKLGETREARTYLEQAASVDPAGYYGLRARDLGQSTSLSLDRPPSLGLDRQIQALDETAGRAEAEAWLTTWLESHDHDLGSLGGAIGEDLRFQRGEELLAVDLLEETKGEFDTLRKEVLTDPLTLYQLALAFRERGLYRLSILCVKRLIQLSPAESVSQAPRFLQRLAYPLYFDDLVLAEAQANGLDPLLLFALIRQESLFEGQAASWAGAQGLTQVMPATGDWIALQLRWKDYQPEHLYRPYLNVKFGAWYLARQLKDFEDNLFAALAAYNGGPGNAARWLELAEDGDDDLFVESISNAETRRYVEKVYEHYARYRALYSTGNLGGFR